MGKNNEMICSMNVVKTLMQIGMPMDMKEVEKDVYEAYCSLDRAEELLAANIGIALEIYPSIGLLSTKYKGRLVSHKGDILYDTTDKQYKTEDDVRSALLDKFASMVMDKEITVVPV